MSQPAPTERLPQGRFRLLGLLAAGFIRLLRATLRVHRHDQQAIRAREATGERFLLAFWHRHLLLMVYAYQGNGISVLMSHHKDGEIMFHTMKHFGVSGSRGSSTRGGVGGARAMLRILQSGLDLGITPDGPKGPISVAKPGAAQLAAMAGIPIIPVAMAASRCRRMRSWDRFIVPMPFSRVDFVYGEPFWVARDADIAAATEELTRRLNDLERRAERLAGTRDPDWRQQP